MRSNERSRSWTAFGSFNLDELAYEYPDEITHNGRTPQEELRHLVQIGIKDRYPYGAPKKVVDLIDHELDLIDQLDYAPYFLTVQDIVHFARSENILCQGRGSARQFGGLLRARHHLGGPGPYGDPV